MKINEEQILTRVYKVEKRLHQTHPDYNFTTKGLVKLIVNIIEGKLNEKLSNKSR